MLERQWVLPAREFWWFVGRLLLYEVLAVLPFSLRPAWRDSMLEGVLITAALLCAVYPVAKGFGFKLREYRNYVAGLKAASQKALLYFVCAYPLSLATDTLYDILLAPWDFHWTNQLLFWNSFSGNPATSAERIAELLRQPWLIPVFLVMICVVAPLTEELLFRRWLYARMRHILSAPAAILINGAVFGVLHGGDFFNTGVWGLFFCWAYERTGRLETSILMHALVNFAAVVILFGHVLV